MCRSYFICKTIIDQKDNKNDKFYIYYICRKATLYFFIECVLIKCPMSNVLDSFIRELGENVAIIFLIAKLIAF